MKHIPQPTPGSDNMTNTASTANLARSRVADDVGQATAEYALVMLAAAGLAGSVLAWAVGTDAIGRLMDAVVEQLIGQVS